jgi:putative transcriptional regulator
MKLQAGILLKSTEALGDDFFGGVIIFIAEYNKEGALGFMINRPFGRSLNELVEFERCKYFPLYQGGPVDNEHLYFLHQSPESIEGGVLVDKGIYYGGNFNQLLTGINNNSLSGEDVKLFVGYCGWNAGELEAEIEEGSWIITGMSDGVFHLFNT